jgi:phage-related protein
MTTFSFIPEYGANLTRKPRVHMAQFGDGYQQRVGDGINTIARSWSLLFKGTPAEIDVIEAVLANAAGTASLDWTPPSGAAGKWICPEWSRISVQYNEETLSTIFNEVFGD